MTKSKLLSAIQEAMDTYRQTFYMYRSISGTHERVKVMLDKSRSLYTVLKSVGYKDEDLVCMSLHDKMEADYYG